MKADIVGGDERESGRRALLNYGHTFGHVLEALAGYDGSLIHGEAVGVGMALAAKFAADSGMIGRDGAQRIVLVLRRLGIPVCLDDLPQPLEGRGDWRKRLTADAILAAMLKDKKAASAGLTLILPADIGDCRARPGVPAAAAAAFMLEALSKSGEMAVAPPAGRRYNTMETGFQAAPGET
jgi:3-dehydroquinate synthetase